LQVATTPPGQDPLSVSKSDANLIDESDANLTQDPLSVSKSDANLIDEVEERKTCFRELEIFSCSVGIF